MSTLTRIGMSSSFGKSVFLDLNFRRSSVVVIGFRAKYVRAYSSKMASMLFAGGGGGTDDELENVIEHK